jgi:hypothetical protein
MMVTSTARPEMRIVGSFTFSPVGPVSVRTRSRTNLSLP